MSAQLGKSLGMPGAAVEDKVGCVLGSTTQQSWALLGRRWYLPPPSPQLLGLGV